MPRRVAALGLLTWIWLLASAPHADAHAALLESTPEDGQQLEAQAAPREIVLRFSEPPDPSVTSILVFDASGAEVHDGPARAVAGDPLEARVELSALPEGVYTVTWRVLSSADGHITAGTLAFGVGVSPAGAANPPGVDASVTTEAPSPIAVAARWGVYVSLAALLGGAAVGMLVSRTSPRGSRPVLVAAWVLGAVSLGVFALAQRSEIGVSWGALFDTETGGHLVAMGAAFGVLGAAVGGFLAAPRSPVLALVGLAAAGAMLIHVLGGHANAPSSLRVFNLAIQWMHLVAVGVWIGGLGWLLLNLRGTTGQARTTLVRRFSFLAGLALGVVAVTGSIRLLDQVGFPASWGRFFTTSFGLTLLLKLSLFAGLVYLGARNRYVHVPGIGAEERHATSLRRTVTAELVLAAGVFGMTGVLTELPPADVAARHMPAHSGATPTPAVIEGSDFATTTTVRLTATPGGVGENRFEVRVRDYDTEEPLPAERVSVRFTLPHRPDVPASTLELERQDEGVWAARGSNLSLIDVWHVSVLVQGATDSVEVEMDLQPRPPPQEIEKVVTAGAPTIYTIALPDGRSVQSYVDPGRAGPNQIHFTFFDARGDELPVRSPKADAYLLAESAADVRIVPVTPGHFTAEADLTPGRWRFTAVATAEDGSSLTAYFEETIDE